MVWIGAVAAETKLLLSGHVWYCQNCPMDGATACGWSKKMNVLILSFCTRTLNPGSLKMNLTSQISSREIAGFMHARTCMNSF